jgi:hypothetical protein
MDKPRSIDPANLGTPMPARRTPPEDRAGSSDHFAAQLGSSRSGRLRFTNGAHRLIIRADLHLRDLYRAHFGARMPMVGVQGGIVTIRYPRVPACDWLDCNSERPAEGALNARIPWDVEVRGDASRLFADLRDVRLGSFRLEGGSARLEVALPAPEGTVAVRFLGGASNVSVSRPEGVALRLCAEGGVTNLGFDERRVGAAGGGLNLKSRDYDGAADRYDVLVVGGANNLTIYQQQGRGRS